MRTNSPITGDACVTKTRRRFDADRTPRELTFSTYRRHRFLSRDRVRCWFAEALQFQRAKHPVDVWAYVLMPDHVHLLVAPRSNDGDVVDIGRFVGRVKESVSRRAMAWLANNDPAWLDKLTLSDRARPTRHFWQPGGGYDRNVTNETTLGAMIDYIHANPVRAGLVKHPTAWEWSSGRWYAGEKDVPIAMDATLPDGTNVSELALPQ